jgi:hypothetical protein
MSAIHHLSAELVLIVSGYLSQVDLLNLALTSQQLRYSTKSEWYRGYYNPRVDRRHVKPYVLRSLLVQI